MSPIRLDLEREFHDRRFEDGEDKRVAQGKYYWAVEDGAARYWQRVRAAAQGARVLEYGCATGSGSTDLKPLVRSYDGIDISEVAIAAARRQHGGPTIRFAAMDAMDMSFPDAAFDLVFGSGIIHHLDTEASMREIRRVLTPGGMALFWEPLGLNPLINLYRRLTPAARTPDEHPLLPRDFAIMRRHFSYVEVQFFGLCTLGAVPFRNRPFGNALRHFFRAVDSAILHVPGIRHIGWYTLTMLRP